MTCLVCGAPEAEPHFGAICCRACAAFFRRYFNSKKAIVSCTCSQRQSNSHPCRECRMKKCLAIGMVEGKVQLPREKHTKKRKSLSSNSSLESDDSPGPSSSVSDQLVFLKGQFVLSKSQIPKFPPPLSLLNCRIASRDSTHLSYPTTSFPNYEQKRNELYQGNWGKWNLYGLTSYVKKDSERFWLIVSSMFPQANDLNDCDKKAMLANFVPKWFQLEPAIDFVKNTKVWKDPNIPVEESLIQYYNFDDKLMSRNEVIKTFGQYWVYYFANVIIPIAMRRFDDKEYMAIFFLLFFDNAYTNISEKCAKMCEDIRKVILRELRGYQRDNQNEEDEDQEDPEWRFLNTVEVLLFIEKGEKNFQKEMLVCEMHNVRVHEDFLEMIRGVRI